MIVIHHNDSDGLCAGFLVGYFARQDGCADIDYITASYEMDTAPVIASILPDETVYVVDWSFKPNEWEQVLAKTKNVVWIDHHATAIEAAKHLDIPGLRQVGKCGALLSWEYLSKGKPVPEFVRLVNDWDVWIHKYGLRTRHFQAGLKLIDAAPDGAEWLRMFNGAYLDEICKTGKVAYEAEQAFNAAYLDQCGYTRKFEGMNCLVLNRAQANSEAAGKRLAEHDCFVTWYYSGSRYIVRMYTGKYDIDVSVTAVKYGGGGHKQAAGFDCAELPEELR